MTTPSFGQPGGTGPNPLVGLPAAPPPVEPLQLQAVTPVAGFAKQNATPTLISWLVPSDGQQHRVVVIASENVTATETGGLIAAIVTPPGGGTAAQPQLLAAASAAGNHVGTTSAIVESGSTVSVQQTSALTAGGPTLVWAEIWGS